MPFLEGFVESADLGRGGTFVFDVDVEGSPADDVEVLELTLEDRGLVALPLIDPNLEFELAVD
jgi:hypothetical protein